MPSSRGSGNRTRKVLSFFRVNFGYRPPYEVLCDGPTIFQSLKNDLYLKQALPKLLGGPAYPVVTQCVVNELRSLGDDYSNAALFAKRVKRVSCVHEGKASPADCLVSRLRNPHDTKLVLATTDSDVVARVARIPGVPVISIMNKTKFALKAPSPASLNFVKELEKTKIRSLSESDKALVDHIRVEEKLLLEKRLVRRKRKRAKGPNPLSVKKPKTSHENSNNNQHRRSSLPSEIASSRADMYNDELHHPATNRTTHEGILVKVLPKDTDIVDAVTEESKEEGNERKSCELPGLNMKKAIKDPSESQEKPTSGSLVVPKSSRKRRRKKGKDNPVATNKTVDLSETGKPKVVARQGEGSLLVKDDSGNIASEGQRPVIQDLTTMIGEGEEGASNKNGAPKATGDHADSERQRLAPKMSMPNAKGPESSQHKVVERGQSKVSSDVFETRNENEKHDTTENRSNINSCTGDPELKVTEGKQDSNESDAEAADAGTDKKTKKKQRKNRRRRPKKTTSG